MVKTSPARGGGLNDGKRGAGARSALCLELANQRRVCGRERDEEGVQLDDEARIERPFDLLALAEARARERHRRLLAAQELYLLRAVQPARVHQQERLVAERRDGQSGQRLFFRPPELHPAVDPSASRSISSPASREALS